MDPNESSLDIRYYIYFYFNVLYAHVSVHKNQGQGRVDWDCCVSIRPALDVRFTITRSMLIVGIGMVLC